MNQMTIFERDQGAEEPLKTVVAEGTERFEI